MAGKSALRKKQKEQVLAGIRIASAARTAMDLKERADLIHNTVVTVMEAYGVALHQKYGFGKSRLQLLEKLVNETIEEWGDMQADGLDYANSKLQEAYDQAMGKK